MAVELFGMSRMPRWDSAGRSLWICGVFRICVRLTFPAKRQGNFLQPETQGPFVTPMGERRMWVQKILGYAAFVTAFLLAVVAVLSLKAFATPRLWTNGFSGYRTYGSHHWSVSLPRRLTTIRVHMAAAEIRIGTRSGLRRVMLSFNGPPAATPHITVNSSTIAIQNRRSMDLGLILGAPRLSVLIPPSLAAVVTDSAGPITVSGQYRTLFITEGAGGITVAHATANDFTARDSAGAITVKKMSVISGLSVSDTAGTIDYQGTLGKRNRFRDTAGDILLRVRPRYRTRVSVLVTAGSLSSAWPEMPSGNNGSFEGVLPGPKPTANLGVADTAGDVTLSR